MGDFLRGEITTRRLQVLIQGLPEGSALHREFYDGHTWTMLHELVWVMLGHSIRNTSFWRSKLRIKGKDKFKLPRFPWSTDESKQKTWGQVAPEDREVGANYLLSLYAPPSETPE